MGGIGDPIPDTIPGAVTEADAGPGEPGFGWKLGEETLRDLESIDENRRLAASRGGTVILD